MHDLTAIDFRQKRITPLPKSDQHPALFGHILDTHTSFSAIAPVRPGQGLPYLRNLDFADAAELILQQGFLEVNLLRIIDMLKAATAADAKMRTSRINPVFGTAQHLDDLAFRIILATVGINKLEGFAGQ